MQAFSKEKLDIIVIAGQSNAEGFGVGAVTEEYPAHDTILWMKDRGNPRFEKNGQGVDVFRIEYPTEKYIEIANEPTEGQGKVGKLAFSFACEYEKNGRLQSGRKVLILHAAVGGTGFARKEWGLGGVLYTRLKDFVRTALSLNAENRLVAFLWHQGECDSFENATWSAEKKYQTHKKNLGEMLADFKREFSCPDLPFIAGGFCDEWYLKNVDACAGVLRAIKEVCAAAGAFVETSGLKSNNEQTGNGDDIHFSRESLRILGKKYYEKYEELTR